MKTRRYFMQGGAALVLLDALDASVARAQSQDFTTLFARALNDDALVDGARTDREGKAEEFDYYATKAIAPRNQRSTRAVSDRAIRTIILFEVSSAARYTAKFQRPVWPKGQSGVTIGVGYDCGYVTSAWLDDDWGGILAAADVAALKGACKVRGASARTMLSRFHGITVPWSLADQQFRERLLPLYVGETVNRLPNTEHLSPDSLGALVSLVYNRGASFQRDGDRYREMRAIRRHMTNRDFAMIPAEISAMTRLWSGKPGLEGLILRRQIEAALFRQGLAA